MPKLVWALLIGALAAIYISYYYRVPADVSILQTDLAHFRVEMLHEKQPMVLPDRVADLGDLSRSWFRFSRVTSWGDTASSDSWARNRFKYLVLQPQEDGMVYLCPPNTALATDNTPVETETVLAVRLRREQLLVVPFRWYYLVGREEEAPSGPVTIRGLGVHDWVTWLLP